MRGRIILGEDNTTLVRISKESREYLRKRAYRENKKMLWVLEEIIRKQRDYGDE